MRASPQRDGRAKRPLGSRIPEAGSHLRGAGPAGKELSPEETAEIEALIQKRAEARKAKDWATADAIRDQLAAMHVVMKDTPHGVEWHVEG